MTDFVIRIIGGKEVKVDCEDVPLLESKPWKPSITRMSYLRWETRINGKKVRYCFHRMVIGAEKGQFVDHINGDTFDNRKTNLRIVSAMQNNWNSANKSNSKSRFKGVGWSAGKWQVSIRDGKRQIYIGRFDSEIEAAYAYDIASIKYHGVYGRRNFLPLV